MVNYVFEDGQNVRVIATGSTGYISSRVPGDGRGTGFYYVVSDEPPYNESGPFTVDELEVR